MIRVALIATLMTTGAHAATCGNTANGFDAWKSAFAQQARQQGVGARGLDALANARYATRTIAADRNQKSFRYTLDRFLEIRGAQTIVAQGRRMKARNAEFYASLERKYGVPAGVLIAIHGMETGFGNFMGDSNIVSAITTLAFDCRRSDFFRPHALAALQLVDQGAISANAIGAKHGELGHTQFLPGNALKYGKRVEVSLEGTRHRITVTVDDDGPGIPPDRHEDAFRPFNRLDPARNMDGGGGSGLGLSIALDAARAHGGDIVLGRSGQGGLRVQLTLPR